MTEIKTQRQAIEALAKWTPLANNKVWAADYYASLMRENVAAVQVSATISLMEVGTMANFQSCVTDARDLTHATIQSLVEGASDE